MKKICSLLVLAIGLSLTGCSLFPTTTTTTITTTSVINTEPVEVWTIADLTSIASTDNIELMADLDLTGIVWTPLCSHQQPYAGTFNGNGHTISNMTISLRNNDYNGLFASITGDVMDLTIDQFSITYTTTFMTYAGALAGELSGDVANVFVDGDISIVNAQSTSYVGLLSGLIQAPVTESTTADMFEPNLISDNHASGSIVLRSKYFAYVGGLAGKVYNSEITGNFVSSSLDVTCTIYRAYVGGLIGHNYGGILIGYEEFVETTDIFISNNTVLSTIDVTSTGTQASVGSLIGYTQFGILFDNYAKSDIIATGANLLLGGFFGESWFGRMDSSLTITTFEVVGSTEEGHTLSFSTICGFANEQFAEEGNYYVLTANIAFTDNGGIESSIGDLSTVAFYQDTLEWDDSIFDFSELISYLP